MKCIVVRAIVATAVIWLPAASHAGFATPGQGITNVISGSVPNGALFWKTVPTWLNSSPVLPYTNDVAFALPACDRVAVGHLVMTVWGGTANYTCQMTVTINGTNLPAANPFVFGTTSDTNAVFNASAPCAYGAGSGLWLVTLPVPGEMLHTDGSSNTVRVVETTPDSFDGRLHHVTLVAVYQSGALSNSFDYALAEGSGDIYGTPVSPQVDQRTAMFGPVSTNGLTAANLTALYTYGDTGQNDRLYFNGTQLGNDDVAQWNKTGTGLNFGPSVVSFDVLTKLLVTNAVKFDVSTADVPGTRETSLRPQFGALAVTRTALTAGQLSIAGLDAAGAHLIWSGPASGSFSIETTTNLTPSAWSNLTNFVSTNGMMGFTDPAATQSVSRFYRAKTQ